MATLVQPTINFDSYSNAQLTTAMNLVESFAQDVSDGIAPMLPVERQAIYAATPAFRNRLRQLRRLADLLDPLGKADD